MRKRIDICCRLLLLMALLAGRPARAKAEDMPAFIRRVVVSRNGVRVQVKVVLSRPVTPQMSTTSAPERVLLDFPGTSSSPHQRRIAVGKDGVEAVRYGLHESSPPVTRLVVDLQRAGKYDLATAGNEITLTITPGPQPSAASTSAPQRRRRSPPPAAANAPWINMKGSGSNAESAAASASTPLPAPREASTPSPSAGAAAPPARQPATFSSAPRPASPPPVWTASQPQPSLTPANSQPVIAAPTPTTTVPSSNQSATSQADSAEPQLSTRPTAAPASEVAASPAAANADIRTVFRVKYVADGAVYLDGGRSDGLAEGVALVVKDQIPQPKTGAQGSGPAAPAPPPETPITARLKIISVAQNSAVCDVSSSTREVKPGDLAYLTSADAEALVQQRALSSTRVYPQVITFTQGDPMDAEVRDEVPRPRLPEINRTRLMFGFDYGGIRSHSGSAPVASSAQYGMELRADMTRIGGSYWNLHGYWRGEMNSAAAAAQPTMQDMINRTYTIGFTYDNPHSHFVAGVGRLYLPWATSLDVIDGGYGGVRIGKHVTTGLFAGSSPDPTSWSYNPDRRIAGNFVNFDTGSYDNLHFTSTVGMGVSTLLWQVDRPFVYLENGISYKRFISVYQEMQADKPRGTLATPSPGAGVSRSYVTVRVQPIQRLSLDFNHNYFRDVPTYDLGLVGTGLLDTVLFQGFSAGARVETVKKIYLYTELGRSTRSGDASSSLNQMYGITFAKIWNTGLHADLHYAKFDSPFAQGNYRAVSLSRNFGDSFQAEVQVGKQAFVSPFTTDNGSKFVNASLNMQVGAHYFFAGGYNLQRGLVENYDQWYFTLGYRFDNRSKVKMK